jgi:hypothetical protein
MSPRLPMVYVEEPYRWQYKHVARRLEKEEPPTEEELNKLGEQGWELSGIFANQSVVHFYFKRPAK